MSKIVEYSYSIVSGEGDNQVTYEGGIITREEARVAKKEWKEIDPEAVILQTCIVKTFKIVR